MAARARASYRPAFQAIPTHAKTATGSAPLFRVRHVTHNISNWGTNQRDFKRMTWNAIFTDRRANCTGLQLADLFARPLGLSVLRPDQKNKAIDVLKPKIASMKIFP